MILIPATVSKIIEETEECLSFELDAPEVDKVTTARPGQFVTARFVIQDASYDRSYSLSSIYSEGEPLRFTVKRVVGGMVSAWCHDNLKVGSKIEFAPPAGHFVVQEGNGPLLFIAAGSGITPIYAMVRHMLNTETRDITLLYVNRTPKDAIFIHDLRRLRDHHAGHMALIELYGGRREPLLQRTLAQCLTSHVGHDTYLCGPEGFMDFVAATFDSLGIGTDRLFTERFSSSRRVPDEPSAFKPRTPAASAAQIVARLGGLRHSFACREGQTVLEAALAAGIPVPSSCKEGHCGACITTLVEGSIDAKRGTALSRRDRLKGRMLTCQSTPTSSTLTIDYDV